MFTQTLLSMVLLQVIQQPPQQQRVEDLTIRGKIVMANPQANDNRIEVRLEKPGLQVVATTYTDSVGNFEFRRIALGTYYVVVEEDGYEEMKQAVEIFSNSTRIYNLTLFLTRKTMITRQQSPAFEGEDPDVIDVSQLNKKFPKKAVQEYEKALQEKKKGQPEKAILRLETAVKMAPDFYQALNNLGVLYQRAKRYRDAEKVYRQASSLNPRASQPLINLGSLFVEEAEARKDEGQELYGNLLNNALDILEESIKLNSRSAIAYYYLGAAYYKSSFYEDAETNLKRAHQLDTGMSAIRLMLANVYIKQQRWPDVLEHLNAYLAENPKAADRPAVEELKAKIVKGLDPPKK